MILSCQNISKAFNEEPVLANVSFHIEDYDKAAIVGINGAGKTTLLRIIVGEQSADEGIVTLAKGKTMGYLAQNQDVNSTHTIYDELLSVKADVISMEEKIRETEHAMKEASGKELETLMDTYTRLNHAFEMANGYAYKSEIVGVLKGLGFTEEEFGKSITTLSGGQKTRVGLGRLLLLKPDLIILDEPTNHLDLPTIEWLEGYLRSYDKAVVIVSHDRMFLDRIIDVTYEIEYHRMKRYPGNYTAFLKRKEEDLAKQEKDYELQQKEIQRLTEWIEKWKNTPTKVSSARSKQMAIEHMVKIEKPRRFDTKTFHMMFKPRLESYSDVLIAKNLKIGYDSELSQVSFHLRKKERLAILGENGKGKSTLLKTLVEIIPPLGGSFTIGQNVEYGYFDQQKAVVNDADPKQTVLDNFWDVYPDMKREEVRSALGSFLFSGEDVEKLMGQLSGGEKVRLALCKMMQTKPNLLILDEPTNHMDIMGKQALEQMLQVFEGTVLFVSHDRYFIKQVATGILEFGRDYVKQYDYNYEEYLIEKQKQEDRAKAQVANNKTAIGGNPGGKNGSTGSGEPTLQDVFNKKEYYNPGKIKSRLLKQLEKYEKQLAESEEKADELKLQLLDPALASDYHKLMELQNALEEEEHLQESLLERMLEAETELEELGDV